MSDPKLKSDLSPEYEAARLRFVTLVISTAEGCADDYFRFVDRWDDDTPTAAWEAAWSDLIDGVGEGVTNLCRAMGMDEITTRCTVDAALTFCLARFDRVNEAMLLREGKVTN